MRQNLPPTRNSEYYINTCIYIYNKRLVLSHAHGAESASAVRLGLLPGPSRARIRGPRFLHFSLNHTSIDVYIFKRRLVL